MMSVGYVRLLNTATMMYRAWRVARRFPDYEPQPVTHASVMQWLRKFDVKDWHALLLLLDHVIYYSRKATADALVTQNTALLEELQRDGIAPANVIYVQVHDAASSSPVMLDLLKRAGRLGRLERLKCHFVDSNASDFAKLTQKVKNGAIVYVDDFCSTGKQFTAHYSRMRECILGRFSEFLLVPCIAEEAYGVIYRKLGLDIYTARIHSKAERPLHPHGAVLDEVLKDRLTELCTMINDSAGLGYGDMATMVAFYRDSPNTMPLVLRGSIGQYPYAGVLPRVKDLAPDPRFAG